MGDKDPPEEVRGFYAQLPERMRQELWRLVEEGCRRELGAQPPPELVDQMTWHILAEMYARAMAPFSRIASTEWLRILGKEYSRLNPDAERGVNQEEVVSAVQKRLRAEHE